MTPRDTVIKNCGSCLLVIAIWLTVSWLVVELTPW